MSSFSPFSKEELLPQAEMLEIKKRKGSLFIGLPKEGNPTLVRAGGVRRDDGISTRVSSVNPVGHLGFHQDPKVRTYALHRP